MDAKAAVARRENELRTAQMESDVALEDRRKSFVDLQAENSRTLADAEAYRLGAIMQTMEKSDPRQCALARRRDRSPGLGQ